MPIRMPWHSLSQPKFILAFHHEVSDFRTHELLKVSTTATMYSHVAELGEPLADVDEHVHYSHRK
jgi:hypothetical protein